MANPTWHDAIDPIAKRFEVAAAFGMETVGSRAIAKIMREMARIIDQEIIRRERIRSVFPPPPPK